jgi:hypothetical protein
MSAPLPAEPPPVTRTITLAEGMTVKDLADKLDLRVKDVLAKLLMKRLMLTINSTLDTDTATMIAREFGAEVQMRSFEQELIQEDADEARAEDVTRWWYRHGPRRSRATSLLDAIARPASPNARPAASRTSALSRDDQRCNIALTHRAMKRSRSCARGAAPTRAPSLPTTAMQTKVPIDHAKAAGVHRRRDQDRQGESQHREGQTRADRADLMPEEGRQDGDGDVLGKEVEPGSAARDDLP